MAKGDLPPGFTVGAPPQAAPAQEDKGALPAGFTTQDTQMSSEEPSHVPYVTDKFKEGLAEYGATPALITDAIQEGLDIPMRAGQAIHKAGQALGIGPKDSPEEAAKQWYIGNDPTKENVGGYKQAKRGLHDLLNVDRLVTGKDLEKEVEIPKDSFGGPSRSAEIQGRIMEYVGADLLPGGGAVAASGKKLLTAVTQAMGDSMAGLSSVEFKHQMGNWAPKFGMTKEQGEALGDQLGGMLGPGGVALAGQKIAQMSNKAVSMAPAGRSWKSYIPGTDASKEAQKSEAAVNVNKEILRAYESNPTNKENVDELIRLQKKMTDFKPGIASATNDPALKMMTQQVSQATPEGLIQANKLAADNKAAIAKFTGEKFPGSDVPITAGVRAANSTNHGQIQEQLNATQRQMTAIGDQYSRSVDKTKVGEDLRELYFTKKEAVKKVLDSQLDDVYAQGDQYKIKIGMIPLRQQVEGIVGSDKETFQDMPGSFKKILNEYAKPEASAIPKPVQSSGSSMAIRRAQPPAPTPDNPTASFRELHSLYKEVNRDWNDLYIGGQLDKARKVSIVKDALKKQVDAFAGPEYGALGEKFRAFNTNYTKYSQTFKEGAGGMLGARGRNGYATDAENIVDKVFLKSGDKQKGVNDFFEVYGNDERAGKLLKDGITDNFSRAAVDADGNFQPKRAAQWLKTNSRAMDQIPSLKSELQKQTDIGGSLLTRQKELYEQRKILDKGVMAQVAKSQDPEKLIAAGMNDPNLFKAMLVASKTPENRASLARAVVDHVTQNERDPYQFLMAHEKNLKGLLESLGPRVLDKQGNVVNEGHWENLKTIAKAQEIADRTKPPSSVAMTKPGEPVQDMIGTSGRSLVSMYRGIAQGRGSKPDMAIAVGGNLMFKVRNDQMKALMQASLFDPDLAKNMAKLVTAPEGAPTKKALFDLKRVAFANGVMIGTNQIATQSRLQDEEKRNPAGTRTGATEGDDKWRRPKSSWMH